MWLIRIIRKKRTAGLRALESRVVSFAEVAMIMCNIGVLKVFKFSRVIR
jgi:hypothetical protein